MWAWYAFTDISIVSKLSQTALCALELYQVVFWFIYRTWYAFGEVVWIEDCTDLAWRTIVWSRIKVWFGWWACDTLWDILWIGKVVLRAGLTLFCLEIESFQWVRTTCTLCKIIRVQYCLLWTRRTLTQCQVIKRWLTWTF